MVLCFAFGPCFQDFCFLSFLCCFANRARLCFVNFRQRFRLRRRWSWSVGRPWRGILGIGPRRHSGRSDGRLIYRPRRQPRRTGGPFDRLVLHQQHQVVFAIFQILLFLLLLGHISPFRHRRRLRQLLFLHPEGTNTLLPLKYSLIYFVLIHKVQFNYNTVHCLLSFFFLG